MVIQKPRCARSVTCPSGMQGSHPFRASGHSGNPHRPPQPSLALRPGRISLSDSRFSPRARQGATKLALICSPQFHKSYITRLEPPRYFDLTHRFTWWAVLGSNQWPLPCETGVGCLRDMRVPFPIATRTCYHPMSPDITQCHDRTVPKLSQLATPSVSAPRDLLHSLLQDSFRNATTLQSIR